MERADFPKHSCVLFTADQVTVVDLERRQEWMTFYRTAPSWRQRITRRFETWWALCQGRPLALRGLWGRPDAVLNRLSQELVVVPPSVFPPKSVRT